MARLSSRDLAALLEFVRGLHDAEPAHLARHCATAVRELIGGEVSTYSDVDLTTSVAIELVDPAAPVGDESRAVFDRYMHEHPLIAHYARTGDGRARKTSDFLTQSQLRRLTLYNEYVKPLFNTHYQIAIAMAAHSSRVIGLSLARARRDFSERERQMLDLLRPHIVQAVRHAESLSTNGVAAAPAGEPDVTGREILVADLRGRIRASTPRAHQWMCRYFGRPSSANRLPDTIWRWLVDQFRAQDRVDRAPGRALVARDGRARLVLRYISRGNRPVVLLERQASRPDAEHFASLGLTPRQSEVLSWVAEGKATGAIAVITGSSVRTVEKHLERIYRTLNVENRTAAAAIVHGFRRREQTD